MATSEPLLAIHLVRHGESAANAGYVTTDPAEIPLTAAGLLQADALSGSLTMPPAGIICSPFLRARQTAAYAARRFGIEPEIWPIQEFTYLAPERCASTTVAERRSWVEAYWEQGDPTYVDGPGAESFAQLMERVCLALERLHPYRGHMLMVGHGQFMQAIRWWVEFQPTALDSQHMRSFRQLDHSSPIRNCEGYPLTHSGRSWATALLRGNSRISRRTASP